MAREFIVPGQIINGSGALDLAKAKFPGFGRKALIVTDPMMVKLGNCGKVEAALKDEGVDYAIYSDITGEPTDTMIAAGLEKYKAEKCDFLIGLGGGSPMDSMKAIGSLVENGGSIDDYMGKVIDVKMPPLVAIPTTAGTGSEADANGVVTNPVTNEKIGLGRMDSLFAKIAIVDPELTASVPPKFTAYQGFDALFHSLECHLSVNACAFSDMVTRTAIENVGKYLARAVKDGNDMEAREGMSFASMLGGYAMITSSCIGEHALEHAMSAYYPALPHGAGLIMISQAYYRHFVDLHCADETFVDMARYLGKQDASKPEDFLDALASLQKACGVDNLKMSDYGIRREDAAKMADNAIATTQRLLKFDPVPLTRDECIKIYEDSWK